MAGIYRSGTPGRAVSVTMQLTKSELRLLLRAMHYAVGGETDAAVPPFYPMSEEVDRLISAMELFFDREKA